MIKHIPTLLCDFYKISHKNMYPKGTELVYSTWTPRTSRLPNIDKIVVFGQQMFLYKLNDLFNNNFFNKDLDSVINEYSRVIKFCLGVQSPDTSHIKALHDLGYLPLEIKSLPEGTVVPIRTPILTIQNTIPEFFWLTNYIETLASCELWQSSTSATIALQYKKILNRYAVETVGNTDFVQFQGHDFSMRGMSSLESAISSGIGHLLSFVGTDTIPAISATEQYYNSNIEKSLIGTSIPATEHSVQCVYGDDMLYFKQMIQQVHPEGFVSIVSDGYDFWGVIDEVLPKLKDVILSRNGKVVIRPDSGDPVLIICGDPNGKTELERKGAVEALFDLFGGTVSEKGYKLLDSHIGLIYGDAITLSRCEEISQKLKDKGFASINVVYGIGSFTYQYNTRDTFGFALKSTLAVVNGEERQIFKNPKTDDGIKKSQKGKVFVYKNQNNIITHSDGHSINDVLFYDLLVTVYKNGVLTNIQDFDDIKNRMLND
jgi:nicotinamide phosphoribosyltransferase